MINWGANAPIAFGNTARPRRLENVFPRLWTARSRPYGALTRLLPLAIRRARGDTWGVLVVSFVVGHGRKAAPMV